jgi:hypothetical protein
MKPGMRRYAVAALLVGCCSLVSCGTRHGDTAQGDAPAPGSSRTDRACAAAEAPDMPVDAGAADGAGVPAAGSHRWFSMTRAFRAYLRAGAPKADAAVAAHVERVCVRTSGDGGRTVAHVWVDYGVWDDAELDRTADAFVHWRRSVYGDHGQVRILAPAKMDAERSW